MKMGVGISPWSVIMVPALALEALSVADMENESSSLMY
jgi:hypothetical protein